MENHEDMDFSLPDLFGLEQKKKVIMLLLPIIYHAYCPHINAMNGESCNENSNFNPK